MPLSKPPARLDAKMKNVATFTSSCSFVTVCGGFGRHLLERKTKIKHRTSPHMRDAGDSVEM